MAESQRKRAEEKDAAERAAEKRIAPSNPKTISPPYQTWKKLYRRQNAAFLQEQIFTPGYTIRLLDKSVRIQVNIGTDHFYDIGAIGPVKEAPRPREVEPDITWVNIGICDDTIEDRRRKDRGGPPNANSIELAGLAATNHT